MSQIPKTGQQCYLSHPPRRKGRNRERGSGDPPGNGKHYPHKSKYKKAIIEGTALIKLAQAQYQTKPQYTIPLLQ